MRLEVLVPQQWSDPSKEFLKPWCTRIGYRPVWTGQFEERYIPRSRRSHRTAPAGMVEPGTPQA